MNFFGRCDVRRATNDEILAVIRIDNANPENFYNEFSPLLDIGN